MIASHLQPAFARHVFPCMDIPEAKAAFEAVVRHPRGTSALSNTPAVYEKDLNE